MHENAIVQIVLYSAQIHAVQFGETKQGLYNCKKKRGGVIWKVASEPEHIHRTIINAVARLQKHMIFLC